MQCADMYLTFEVNTSKVKSSRHIKMNYENKKARAVGLAESIMNQCIILYNSLRSVVKVDKMCRLHNNFLFILGMLNSLGSQCDVMHRQFIMLALHTTTFWLICAKMRR